MARHSSLGSRAPQGSSSEHLDAGVICERRAKDHDTLYQAPRESHDPPLLTAFTEGVM